MSQVDGASDMAPTCQLCGFMGKGFRKGTMASAHLSVGRKLSLTLTLMPDISVQFLPVCHWCLSICFPSAGAQREWVWVSSCLGLLTFFHWLNPCWFLQTEVVGTHLARTGTLGHGAWCGAWTPCSQYILPEFLSTTCGCGTSHFCISAPLTSLDGCSFFSSTVVRLPFNSLSASSEWWLFYSLVVILMWLCEEVSRVYLCRHPCGSLTVNLLMALLYLRSHFSFATVKIVSLSLRNSVLF